MERVVDSPCQWKCKLIHNGRYHLGDAEGPVPLGGEFGRMVWQF